MPGPGAAAADYMRKAGRGRRTIVIAVMSMSVMKSAGRRWRRGGTPVIMTAVAVVTVFVMFIVAVVAVLLLFFMLLAEVFWAFFVILAVFVLVVVAMFAAVIAATAVIVRVGSGSRSEQCKR